MVTATKKGETPAEVTEAEGEQEVKAFWSQLHEWELIKPFWGFFCSFFLSCKKKSAINNKRLGTENESKR